MPTPTARRLRQGPRLSPMARAIAAGGLLALPLWLQAQVLPGALPHGLQVVQGKASVATQGAQMTVRNSAGAILNWNSFNIGVNAGVHFEQASAASKVLNRVTGSEPSALFGSLTSNGQVWLLNPHGVLFGAGARVDVASLVTSTLRLNDNDFLAGRYRFSATERDAGSIHNEGSLRSSFGGQVVLLAERVENRGQIQTDGGSTTLVAARSVELVDTGLPNLVARVDVPAGEVLNLGRLSAAGGSVDVYGGIVNQQGLVQADTLGTDAQGRIVLKAADTLLLAADSRTTAMGAEAGQQGGRIDLLGAQVGLLGRAEVDASGQAGGGGIRVGGGLQGRERDVGNARAVVVGSGVTLRADAGLQGDGGRVIVWADEGTRFAGLVSARGAGTGAGGFAEVSGKGSLEFTGRADLGAAGGALGMLLLDPQFIVVQAANPNIDGTPGSDLAGPTVNFNDFSGTSIITAGAVDTQLAAANVTLQAQIDITVNAAITHLGSNALTLQAGRDILVNAPITVTGGINLFANDPAPAAFALGKSVIAAGLDTGGSTNLTIRNDWGAGAPGTNSIANALVVANALQVQGPLQLGSAVTLQAFGASQILGDITGSGGFQKLGAGVLTLKNASFSTFSGAVDIQAGTVRVDGSGGSQVLGLGIVNVASGATLDLANGASVANDMVLAGGRVNGSSGVNQLGGNILLSAPSTLSASAAGPSLSIAGSGNLGGAAAVTIDGGDVRFENSSSSHSGGTVVTGGATLSIVDGATLGSGSLTLDSGGLSVPGAAIVNVSNPLVLGNGGGSLSAPLSASVTLSGGVSGTGALVTGDIGVVSLGAAATHTGGTVVGSGTLQTLAANLLPDGANILVSTGASLTLGGADTIGSLTGGGNVSLGGALTTGGDNLNTTFSGVMSGAGSLAKAGTGTFTLTGASTYSGGTTIQAGRLDVSGATAVAGTGLITIEAAGVLGIVDTAVVQNDVLARNGATIDTAPGASPFFTKGTLGSGGTLILDDGATLNIGAGAATADLFTYIDILRVIPETPGGAPESVNIVTRANFGQDLVHSYSGGTTISTDDGRANVKGAASQLGTGPINLVNRGNLDLNGVAVANAILVVDGFISSDLNPASVTGPVSVSGLLELYGNSAGGGLTVSSVISGAGGVILGPIGGGTPAPVTLTGANTYTGTTTVSGFSGGTRVAQLGAGALPAASTLIVEANGVLDLLGNNTGAAFTLAGTVNGAFTLTAPTYTLQTGALVNANLGAGALDVTGNATLSGTAAAVSVNLSGGTLTLGSAERLSNAATLTVNVGATLDMGFNFETVGQLVLNGGTLTNGGSLIGLSTYDLRSGIANVDLAGSVGLTKTTAGTVTLSQANSYTGATSVNAGTLVTGVAGALPAGGSLFVSGGTLDLGATTQSASNVSLSAGAIDNGTLNSANTFSLSGGQLSVGGRLGGTVGAVVNGNVAVTGQLQYAGTTVLQAGTLTVDSAQTLPSVQLQGGSLGGSGSVTVTGPLDFSSGSVALQGAGTLTTQGSTTVNMSSPAQSVGLTKPWVNEGTLSLAGDDQITLSTGGSLTNATAGVINLSGSNTTPLAGSAVTITNAGTLNNLGATSHTVAAGLAFNNSGTVNVQGGTLVLPATTTQSGVIDIASGATLAATGNLTNASSGVIQGLGTLDIGGFTLTNLGTIQPGGTGFASTLSVTGNVDLATGTLDFDLGGTGAGQSDLLAITGNVTLGGTVSAALIGGYTPANADFIPIVAATGTRSGSFATLDAAPGFTAGYSLAAGEAARLIYSTTGSTLVFTNAAGDLNWGTPANWGGTLPGANDSALISAGFAVTHASGTDSVTGLTINSSNALNVSGGSLAVSGSTTLGGSLQVSGSGAVTLGGAVTGGGAVAVSGGSLTLNGATSLSALSLTGGLLNGSGSLTVNGSFGRSGGASVGSGFSSVDITQASGTLQPGAWTADSLSFTAQGATASDLLLVDGALVARSGDVTLSAAGDLSFQSGVGSVAAAGNAVFSGANQVNLGGPVTAQRVQATSPNLVQITGGGVTASAATGDAIVLSAGVFRNLVGAGALSVAGGARWLVYSGDPALDTVGGLAYSFKQYNAPYPVAPAAAGSGLLYSLAPTLTATLQGSVNKVYDTGTAATLAPANYSLAGALAGDTLSLNNPAAGSYTSAGTGATPQGAGTGKTVSVGGVVATAVDASTGVPVFGYGFSGTASGVVGTITPAALALTGTVVAGKVYDGTLAAVLSTLGSVSPLGSDVVGLAGGSAAFADKNVGTAKPVSLGGVTLTGADAANYTLQLPTGLSANITPLALPVSGVTALGKVYDATPAAVLGGSAAVTALAGDSVALGGTPVGVFSDKNVGVAKPVAVSGFTLGGVDAGNYTLQPPAGLTATITPATLAITGLTAANKVYDATLTAPLAGTAAVTPLGADTVNLAGTASGSFASKAVGSAKPVTVTGLSLAGADAANYSALAPTGLVADITPATLTLAAVSAASKAYDTTTATTASATLGGVLAGDTVSVGLAASFSNANVGTAKPVNYSATLGGVDAANYSLSAPTGSTTANITPLTLSYVAAAASGTAGSALPSLTGSVAGFFGSESLASATTGTLTWTTPATAASPAGSYAINGGGLAALNYVFVQAPGNASALTLTAPPQADPATNATNANNTALTLGLQTVQVALAMSTPTENRVLDVTPALSPAAAGGSGLPSFRPINFSLMPRDEVQSLLAAREKYKKQAFAVSLFKLEQDPTLADVRPCSTEAELNEGNCLITEALKQQIQEVAARAVVKPRKPDRRKIKQAVLPNIERKLALLIGINKYNDKRVPELEGSVRDARAVRTLLETRLGYETTVVEDASREALIRAFNKLALEADANDSVVIYYAGHGDVVPVKGEDVGYWIPADANADNPATWVSNADIARLVSAIGARQLMLISDSCFSGTLVGSEKVQLSQSTDAADLLKRKAAVVMSSGGNEPVADEGRDGHSFFAWHLMRAIEGLDNWQVGGNVFQRVRDAVVREKFPQTPQYGASRSAGHQGNTDYLFERREFDAP